MSHVVAELTVKQSCRGAEEQGGLECPSHGFSFPSFHAFMIKHKHDARFSDTQYENSGV